MALIINPQNGEVLQTDDPTAYYAMGYRDATAEELDHSARVEEFGGFEQQAQAQAERVVRGATLGAVEGFGDDPEAIRARAEVSEELSPVTSFAASVVPDLGVAAVTGGLGGLASGAGRAAARTALAEGAGLVRAGLAAGRAGGAAALAGESLGTAAVGAGQQAYAEGRELGDDPGADAENALIWGGLNFGLGSFMMRRGAKAGAEAIEHSADDAARQLDDVAAAAEVRAKPELPELPEATTPGTPGQIYDVEGAPASGAQEFVPLETQLDGALERSRQRQSQAGSVALYGDVVGQASYRDLSPEAQGALGRAALASDSEALDPTVARQLMADIRSNPYAKRVLTANDATALETFLLGEQGFKMNPRLARKYGRIVGHRGLDPEAELSESLGGLLNNDVLHALTRDEKINEAFELGLTEGETAAARVGGKSRDQAFAAGEMGVVKPQSRALDIVRKYRAGSRSPVDLTGREMADLGALGLESAEDQARVAALTKDPAFRKSGRVSSNDGEQGITIVKDDKYDELHLRDGRHRLEAARKLGRRDVWGRVVDGETGKEIYQGPIPIGGNIGARTGERGAVDLAGLATSPMGNVIAAGAGAAIGGAVGGDTESIAAGGALGFAASALAGRFGRRAMAAAVRQGEREAVEGGVERALRNASKSDAADVVERAIGAEPKRAVAREVENEASSFGRQRRLYINRKEIREVAAREMGQDLTELVENVRQVAGVEKQAAVAQRVSDNLPAQRAVADGVAKDAAQFVGELKAEARAYGAAAGKKGLQYAIPGQRDLALSLMDHAKEIAQARDGKALFEALDGFKRAAQEHKLSLEKGALNSESAIHYDKLIPRVETFASKIRSALEDSNTWGKAGEMQRAYNAVISDKLIPHMKIFEESVLKRTHQGYDGLWKTEGWESKISALLADADPGKRRHVLAMLDAMDELGAVQRKFGTAKEADAIAKQVGKVRRTIGLADELTDAEERMHALGQIIGGGPMGGFLAGGLAGGVPGAVIGAALPGAVRGLVMGDLIQAFGRLSGATDAAAQRGVDDWIRSSRVRSGGPKIPKLPQLSDEAAQLRDVAARRGITQAMVLFQGEDSTPHAAYQRLQEKLFDQEKFFEDLSKEYGTLQEQAPDVFMMIAARADVARRFLIDRMPPNVAVSARNPNGYPPSREAIEDWATYVNAVRYPTRVMANLGSLRVQEIETLRTVHPRAHELLQQRVLEGLSRSEQLGEQLDDSALAKIGILFPDLDGFASPVFSREMGQVIVDKNLAMRQAGGGKSTSPMQRQPPGGVQGVAQGGATLGTGF